LRDILRGRKKVLKHPLYLRMVLKNCHFPKENAGATASGRMAAPGRATSKNEPFSKRKWRERRGSNPRPSA
jgi:hypothetical protein